MGRRRKNSDSAMFAFIFIVGGALYLIMNMPILFFLIVVPLVVLWVLSLNSKNVRRAPKNRKIKPKHNPNRCDGDCDNCPSHYGYRHGRWYYGHGHQHGCERGGNGGAFGHTYRD